MSGVTADTKDMYWGRAFDLFDGQIVLPCEFCGNPAFVPEKHTCEGLTQAVLDEMSEGRY